MGVGVGVGVGAGGLVVRCESQQTLTEDCEDGWGWIGRTAAAASTHNTQYLDNRNNNQRTLIYRAVSNQQIISL